MNDSLAHSLQNIGVSTADCIRVAAVMREDVRSQQPVLDWKERLRQTGFVCQADELERFIVRTAAADSLPKIDSVPVHAAVRRLMRKELERFLRPHGPSDPAMAVGSYYFDVAFKMASLRRFPAGAFDWAISGVPRPKLLTIQPAHILRAWYYIFRKFGGLKPAFYVYVAAPPRTRTLVIETEVRRSYYRMAKSLELQPTMLGIMTISWLHDPTMLARMPHLAAINEPFTSGGGFVAPAALAPPDSGFLERSPERQKQYESGELRPRLTFALWPRDAAIDWAAKNPHLE